MPTLLIVDDRSINRELLAIVLGQAGYGVVEAADGVEALAAARACRPDLVITDVRMANMGGDELLQRFRADPDLADVPFIMYTAAFNFDDLGGTAADRSSVITLQKPSAPEEILAAVGRALRTSKAAPPARASRRREASINAPGLGLRAAALLELGLALASERDPATLLRLACQGARDILKAPHVAIAVVGETGRVTHLETFGMGDQVLSTLGSRPAEASFLAPFHPAVAGRLVQAIKSPSRCYGWLYAAGCAGGPGAVAEAGQAVNIVAKQLALAWENAHRQEVIVNREKRMATIIESAIDAIITLDEEQRILQLNAAAEKMFGYRRAELIGQPLARLLPEQRDLAELFPTEPLGPAPTSCRSNGAATGRCARRADGAEFPAEASVFTTLEDGVRCYTLILRDIGERKQIEAELRVAATAFEAQVGIVVTDVNTVIMKANRAFTEITGYSNEEAVGRTPRMLSSGRHDKAFFAAMWDSIKHTGSWQGEIWDRRKNGEIYPSWQVITAMKGADGITTHYVSTQIDITDRKAADEKIRYLAYYDPLTSLPNRRLLLDRLQHALQASARSHRRGALLFIDLDNFKEINDSLGHHQGDVLLQQVAQHLSSSVREGDTVARLGGDEFVVILEDLSPDANEAAAQTEAIGEKIFAALNGSYFLDGHEQFCTPSIGATLFGNRDETIDGLLKEADVAMYQAKAAGRNALRFFDPVMHAAVAARSAFENDLRNAVREGQFVLHYQAQVDDEGCVHGVEALLRWQHPQRGLILPDEFIPLAEETGLILPIGLWVLDTACAQLARWAAYPATAHLAIAVNVSLHQLRQRDNVEQVIDVLQRAGADPCKLKLELTESQVMTDIENTIGKMTRLRAMGISFALDDFGTGYSSLAYLKRLPLEKLKIDSSFVSDVLTNPNDAAIARTIVALTQSLGLAVIAEGVETAGQRDFLSRNGCRAYQGYLFSRPLAIDAFERYLDVTT